jgi:AmmeMemoRadiSam system protein B/AmmeMemoRadiSam system protein A
MNKRLKTILYGIIITLTITLSAKEFTSVLKTDLPGSWYPASAQEIRRQLADYLKKAAKPELKNVIALLMPHAGYMASGQTAAYGLKQLTGKKYSRVIIIAPSHYAYLHKKLCIPNARFFQTPLGKVPIDQLSLSKLKEHSFVVVSNPIQEKEHSLQIQLPILQYALKDFKVVPIVVGMMNDQSIKLAAEAIKLLITPGTLVVVSSDFTHFGKRFRYMPFKVNSETGMRIRKLDMGAFKCIEDKNAVGFGNYVRKTGATICGQYPIRIFIRLLPPNAKVSLLSYSTSAQIFGNNESSVSYVAAAVTGKWPGSPAEILPELTAKDKANLLLLARKTIAFHLRAQRAPHSGELIMSISPNMKKVMGVFVTLHKNGRLRGCIGEIIPRRPLYKAVIAQAVNSAFHDPRFRPLNASEFKDIDIEISALTPPHPVKSWQDIVIGRDGIILEARGHSAVFLPQVATEQGWTLPQTLSYLSRKAGLPADAWKKDAKFKVFQAIVFGEKKKPEK